MQRFSGRVAGLDASRTTLMFFGLVVHASAIGAGLQVVTDAPADNASILISIFGHNFRMPAFFMVSGIFSAYLLNTRGLQRFWAQRRRRLVYPLLAASLTLLPVSYWILLGAPASFEQVLSLGTLHLWFIYYLIWFSLAVILIEWLLGKANRSIVNANVRPLGFWLVNPVTIIVIAILSTLIPHWFDESSGALQNNSSLFPPIGLVTYYSLFFLFGLLLYRYWVSAEKWLRQFWPMHLLLGLAAFAFSTASYWGFSNGGWLFLSYSLTSWMLSLSILGIFLFFVRQESRFVRYLSDASYWIYLIHYPIMVILQRWFAELKTGLPLALLLGITIDVAVSLGLYQIFVKDKWIGLFLAGKLPSQIDAKRRKKPKTH